MTYKQFSNEMSRLLSKPSVLFDAVSVVTRAKEYADFKAKQSSTKVKGINIRSDKENPNSLANRLTNPNWYSTGLMDVETPYKARKTGVLKDDMNIIYELQVQKFQKNPELIDEINAQGGLEFIKNSSHNVGVPNSRWEGDGMESNFIKVLAKSYTKVAKDLGKFMETSAQENITFDELTEFTDDRKQEIIINFANRHEMSKEEVINYFNETIQKGKKEEMINTLKECY